MNIVRSFWTILAPAPASPEKRQDAAYMFSASIIEPGPVAAPLSRGGDVDLNVQFYSRALPRRRQSAAATGALNRYDAASTHPLSASPRLRIPASFLLLACLLSSFATAPTARAAKADGAVVKVDRMQQAVDAVREQPLSVVRVNTTNQPYDFFRPWSKKAPYQRRAVGAVLPGKRVLVTAEMAANATYLELEKADSGEKVPAVVEAVDYECNLALLKASADDFLDGFKPLSIKEPSLGDDLAIWQLENNGTLLSTRALLTTAEVDRYPIGDTALLIYRLTSALQPRDGGFTSPVVKGNELAGMLLRFDSRTQNADVIPAPVIQHFLKAAADKAGYNGFPRLGVMYSPLRDPQLRRYAGLTNGNGGVYLTQVQRGSAGAKAGLQPGDVLFSVGDKPVDRDGNYNDPHYGKVSVIHLLSSYFEGDVVPFKIAREGKEQTLQVTLSHPDQRESVIEPYTIDKAPRYYVLGGVVLQELSRQYLKEWGPDWPRKAPEKFVYLDRYQSELFEDDPRQRVVILSNILPSPCTVGYEELHGLVVTKINGVAIKSLADLEDALAHPVDGFHRIELQEHPGEIVLDARQVSQSEALLLKNYGLPAIKRL
ncbi:MAG: PDZ domain-containing protein [Verrucomicrobiota bacterium]